MEVSNWNHLTGHFLASVVILLAQITFAHTLLAGDSNLDKPKFKAGDCVLWTPYKSSLAREVKITEVRSITVEGTTFAGYELERDGERLLGIPVKQFEMGETVEIPCTNVPKKQSGVEDGKAK